MVSGYAGVLACLKLLCILPRYIPTNRGYQVSSIMIFSPAVPRGLAW